MRQLPPKARARRIASLELAMKHDAEAVRVFAQAKHAVCAAVLSRPLTRRSLPAMLREIDAAIDAASAAQLDGVQAALMDVATFKAKNVAQP